MLHYPDGAPGRLKAVAPIECLRRAIIDLRVEGKRVSAQLDLIPQRFGQQLFTDTEPLISGMHDQAD